MRAAMASRMRDSGSASSRGPSCRAGAGSLAGGATGAVMGLVRGADAVPGTGAIAGAVGGAADMVAACAMAASTSSRIIRPAAPDPRTVARSMPCSAAIRRTMGDSRVRPSPSPAGPAPPSAGGGDGEAGAGARGAEALAGGSAARGRATGAGAGGTAEEGPGGADSGAARAASSGEPIRASPRQPRRSRSPGRGSRAGRRCRGWGSPSRPCRWTPRAAGRRSPRCRRPPSAT